VIHFFGNGFLNVTFIHRLSDHFFIDFCLYFEGFPSLQRIGRLMYLMGLTTRYSKPNLSLANKEHRKYPYLLRDIVLSDRNQFWVTDITYIPMKHGFIRAANRYLMVVVDLYSRKVHYSVSTSMDAEWCTELLSQRITMPGTPETFNTGQGS
jgi:putative transposase